MTTDTDSTGHLSTEAFLRAILPEEGIYMLMLPDAVKKNKSGEPVQHHRAFTDFETMAAAVHELADDPRYTGVFHALASFYKPFIEVEHVRDGVAYTRRHYRVDENKHRIRSFWMDLDVGDAKAETGAGYPSQRAAVADVFRFADALSLPRPLVVSSGWGIHTYWPLTKSISYENWKRTATRLKAATEHFGLRVDPSRTSDASSVLRPVGALNRKREDNHRTVRALTPTLEITPEELYVKVKRYNDAHNIVVETKPFRATRTAAGNDLNADLLAHAYPDIPTDANQIADHCPQIAAVRDTGGHGSHDHWRGALGVVKFCEKPDDTAQLWSSRRLEKHDQDNWVKEFDSWTTGPTSCTYFEQANPGGCTGCQHQGKIKSPVVLGRQIPEPVPIEVEVPAQTPDGEADPTVPAAMTLTVDPLPSGYVWDKGLMSRLIKDKEGILHPMPFSAVLFYPTSRIRGTDGTYRFGIRAHMPNGSVRNFELPAESMASQTDMLRGLAKYELMQSNHKDAGVHMSAYLRDQLEVLKRKVEEVNTMVSFGWMGNDFLLGDRLYKADGSQATVLLGEGAKKYAVAYPAPKGSVRGYSSALNYMYNRRGMEHWQYTILSGWGSLLNVMGEDSYRGMLFAVRGGDSGKGKTTACQASMYAFGDATESTLASKEGFTTKALWMVLQTLQNMPLLLDELTGMDADDFSDIAYNVSLGRGRERLTSKGGQVSLAGNGTWRLTPFVTGNKDFHGLLASTQANSQAEAVRLIQLSVDQYPVVQLDPDPQTEVSIVQSCVTAMKDNCGSAGEELIKYVVANYDATRAMVQEELVRWVKYLPETKYRFYRNHAACTFVIGRIAKQLGIIEFDLDVLETWTQEMLRDLADTVAITNTVSVEDAFGSMVAALGPRIMVTTELRDQRGRGANPETPRNRVHGVLAGRYIMGTPNAKEHANQLFLVQKDVRDWCVQNRTDYNAVVKYLDSRGAILNRSEKVYLTKGTDAPPHPQTRCLVIDMGKLDHPHLVAVPTRELADTAVGDV